jgi:hypothetical protein
MAGAAGEFARAVRRLVDRVSRWTPSRWAASSPVEATGPIGPTPATPPPHRAAAGAGAGTTRADVVHALVQAVADLAADAEGQPRRPVPRLDNDLVLPDQLRVMAADLVASASTADALRIAAARVTAVNRSLTA